MTRSPIPWPLTSPSTNLWCLCRLCLVRNRLSQTSQPNGRCPVWFCEWSWSEQSARNDLVQPSTSHLTETKGERGLYHKFGRLYHRFGRLYHRFGRLYHRFGRLYHRFGRLYHKFGRIYQPDSAGFEESYPHQDIPRILRASGGNNEICSKRLPTSYFAYIQHFILLSLWP